MNILLLIALLWCLAGLAMDFIESDHGSEL